MKLIKRVMGLFVVMFAFASTTMAEDEVRIVIDEGLMALVLSQLFLSQVLHLKILVKLLQMTYVIVVNLTQFQ